MCDIAFSLEKISEKLFPQYTFRVIMIFFSKWYRNLLRSTVASVLKLEKERKIRSDFIEFYENSYKEKEKLWKHFNPLDYV